MCSCGPVVEWLMAIFCKCVSWKEKTNRLKSPEIVSQRSLIPSALKEWGVHLLEKPSKENSSTFNFSIWCAFLPEKKLYSSKSVLLSITIFFLISVGSRWPYLLVFSSLFPFPVHIMACCLGAGHLEGFCPCSYTLEMWTQCIDVCCADAGILYAVCTHHKDMDGFQCREPSTVLRQIRPSIRIQVCFMVCTSEVMSWALWTVQFEAMCVTDFSKP